MLQPRPNIDHGAEATGVASESLFPAPVLPAHRVGTQEPGRKSSPIGAGEDLPSIDLRWWGTLKAGDRVQIIHNDYVQAVASVDVLMPDGSVVWLWQDKGLGRIALTPHQGLRLRKQSPN
jgi:hypothetical protein